jgi:copper homeostasis protein (lipoprotein)
MRNLLTALALLALAGCKPVTVEPEMADAHPLGTLPATFSGTLPYSPEMDVHLNLMANGAYFLRESRSGESYFDIGRYLLSSDGQQLSLYGGREGPARYAISTPDTLIVMDPLGLPKPDYRLSRQPNLQPLEPRLRMRGEYRYLAGAGRFRECLTGLDMPVAQEGDNRALEEAYVAQREAPGEALMVHVGGRIAQRMPMEGPGPVSILVPEQFNGVSAYGCPE